jgi:hypothetical protein
VLVACFATRSSLGFSPSSYRNNGVDKVATTTRLEMATWSDSKAVKDYQDFLASGRQEIERKADGPSVIIRPFDGQGSTVLADALVAMGMGDDIVVTPDIESLPESLGGNSEYPIYITLPPTQIENFIKDAPLCFKERDDDYVFFSGGLQYGNIEDVLKGNGCCRDSMTQVLITGLEVTPAGAVKDVSIKLGADAMGAEKLAGECAACGKWNGAIAERLEKNNIRCLVDFYREWRRRMWEGNVMDAIFHLVGAVRTQETNVKDVANYYSDEVSDMVWQTSGCLRGWKALTLTYGVEERIFGVAENTGSSQPCVLVDEMYPYIWGNRVFTEGKMFLEYLWFAKEERGFFQSVELPRKRNVDEESRQIMRQGVMRADGKI